LKALEVTPVEGEQVGNAVNSHGHHDSSIVRVFAHHTVLTDQTFPLSIDGRSVGHRYEGCLKFREMHLSLGGAQAQPVVLRRSSRYYQNS